MTFPLLVALRPRDWVKNGFVFVAPLFARRLATTDGALSSLAAFLAFTAVASGTYLLNDVADRERDRAHAVKRERPIASGALGVPVALFVAVLLYGAGVTGGFLLSTTVGCLLGGYVVIQIAYSFGLREQVILDVFCIASGFVLRVLVGAAAVRVPVSSWLILTTIFVSLFLALLKRRAEVAETPGEHRKTLREYDPAFLDQLVSVTTASIVMCYSLYTLDSRTVREFGTRNLVFTVPFVIYGVFRYLYLVHRRRGGGAPAETVIRDPGLLVNATLWLATTVLIIYG